MRSGEKVTSRIHVHVPWHFSRLHLLPPTSPLRLVVRRGGSFTSSRAHTHTGNKRGGVGAVGGEFDRRIFNAIKNKPLPSRVPYLLSRLDCDATRRDAAHVAFPNGNKLRIFRRGEIFIGQSVHWRGEGLVNTGSPSTRGNLFATDSSIDRGLDERRGATVNRFVTDPCRSTTNKRGRNVL